jgi:hypothetical protein
MARWLGTSCGDSVSRECTTERRNEHMQAVTLDTAVSVGLASRFTR